jgi:hypothetical protein
MNNKTTLSFASVLAMLVGSGVGLKVGTGLNDEPKSNHVPGECAPVVLQDGQQKVGVPDGDAALFKTALLEQSKEVQSVQQSSCRFYDEGTICHVYDGVAVTETWQMDGDKDAQFYELAKSVFETPPSNLGAFSCNFVPYNQTTCVGTGVKIVSGNAVPSGSYVLHGNLVEVEKAEEPTDG